MDALKVGKYARYGSVFFNSFVRRSSLARTLSFWYSGEVSPIFLYSVYQIPFEYSDYRRVFALIQDF